MKYKSRGFALIEVIVSMVILAIMLAAAVGLLWSVSSAIEANRDRLAATYLAQECLEITRNVRDTSWRNHRPWDCGWDYDYESSDCSTEKQIINELSVPLVNVNEADTKFSRELEFSPSVSEESDDEILVTCTVTWPDGSLSLSEILTNWRKI